jgi:hypothetical protein
MRNDGDKLIDGPMRPRERWRSDRWMETGALVPASASTAERRSVPTGTVARTYDSGRRPARAKES